jgi:hypothetical protein
MTEERILDFLDGNLGASEEEELLHRLAVSPERRNLLKQHLQMRELTASLARRQFVPVPKTVTASLFTTLASNGYAGPNIPSELNQKESLIASLEKNLDKSAQNIVASKNAPVFRRSSLAIASIVSFIMGAAVLYLLMPQSRQEKFVASVSNIFQGQSKTLIAASIPVQSSAVPLPEHQTIENTNINSSIPMENEVMNIKSSSLDGSSVPVTENNSIKNDFAASGNDDIAAISAIDSKNPSAIALSEDIHGTGMTAKNPFDPANNYDKAERSFWQRFAFSIRGGEGKAPGNQQALTGSLIELKASYDIGDWFIAKVSLGRFLPYETEAVAAQPGFNNDGIPLFQLSPVLKYRYTAGAEIGAKFAMFNAPFELSGGFISDLQGNIIPRGGFFTSLALQDDISMNLGLEGMIYTHNISSSIRNAQNTFAGEHPLFIGTLQQKESTGFIGPAVELVWHL